MRLVHCSHRPSGQEQWMMHHHRRRPPPIRLICPICQASTMPSMGSRRRLDCRRTAPHLQRDVVFEPQFVLIVVIRQRWRDVVQGNKGLELLSDAGSESSGDASRSSSILFGDCPVMRLQRVTATAATPRIATTARPPRLGAGTVARSAGAANGAEAAEVLAGLVCCFLAAREVHSLLTRSG